MLLDAKERSVRSGQLNKYLPEPVDRQRDGENSEEPVPKTKRSQKLLNGVLKRRNRPRIVAQALLRQGLNRMRGIIFER